MHNPHLSEDLLFISGVKGNHLRRIAELESLQQLDIDVTTVERTRTVRLAAGRRVQHPLLGPALVLWSPGCNRAKAVVTESSRETESRERVKVQGEYMRQWGTEGAGQGQFHQLSGVGVSGPWGRGVRV